jgi:hypothetical protein
VSGGRNGRTITITEIGDVNTMSVVPGHEVYRDGEVGANNEQETRNAVIAHTKMGVGRGVLRNSFVGLDLAVYDYARSVGKMEIMEKYADALYDSSGDYWKLVVNNDGSHEFQWDGNLNIYDENGNMLVSYKDIIGMMMNGKANGNKDIGIGAAQVSISELEELQIYNNRIVQYAKNNNSSAAEALLDDGFMSMVEAADLHKEIMNRYKNNFLSGPNMIEHWSVRYVLNDTDTFVADIGDNTYQWIKESDRKIADKLFVNELPANILPFENLMAQSNNKTIEFELLPSGKSIYHGKGNFKWQSDKYGNELVFRNGKIETDPRYIGTFNFGLDESINHFNLDVLPYYKWGNSPNDLSNHNNRIDKRNETLR